jgi:uncharacterized membrane protein SirB2
VFEVLTSLEATALAQHLKVSRWTYPLVNAGHILGIALLIGAVVPMDLRILRGTGVAQTVALLRPFAYSGLLLAVGCGLLLFIVQPVDYAASPWFRGKLALLALAIGNALLHRRIDEKAPARQRLAAGLSLALWPAVLLSGRMIAYG